MSEEAEQDFQPGVVSGDRVLLVLEDGGYEAGVLLGMSNIGIHLLSTYVQQANTVKVVEQDRKDLIEVLDGLTGVETLKAARAHGIKSWWKPWVSNADLKQEILNLVVDQIESQPAVTSVVQRPVGIPMIIPMRRINTIAHLDRWDEDVTLRQTELDLGDIEAAARAEEVEEGGAEEAQVAG